MSGARDSDTLQPLADQTAGLSVQQYFSDGLEAYRSLWYGKASHAVAPGKSQTYSVEAVNADLRHYLARLGRRSRCFTRSVAALGRALSLFAYCYNARQLHKRRYPKLAAHLIDFLPAPN